MASISILDLVDSRYIVDFDNSEMENIQGGFCREGFSIYPEGSIVKRGDGYYYKCTDRPWYKGGDVWRVYKP